MLAASPQVMVFIDDAGAGWVPTYTVQEPALYGDREIAWSCEDVVLVTGGARGITPECAIAFAPVHRRDDGAGRLVAGADTAVAQRCRQRDPWGANGPIERLAFGQLKTTWVEILGHGMVRPEPFPPFYHDFMQRMAPRHAAPTILQPMPEPFRDAPLGRTLFKAKNGPRALVPLAEKSFETSQ
jgi:hypothetical protein